MSEFFKRKIMDFVTRRDYTPVKLGPLAAALQVPGSEYDEFRTAFDDLRKSGRLVIGADNLVTLPQMSSRVIGTFTANPKGFGFVTPLEPNAHGDLFIPPDYTNGAMTGDTVLARVRRKAGRARRPGPSGRVVEVLERAQNKFVGTLLKKNNTWLTEPDGRSFVEPIIIDDVAAKGAKENDKVVVEILSYPTDEQAARGVIVEVLGRAGRYDTEINAVIRRFHLPREFPEDCHGQARSAAEGFDAEAATDRDDVTQHTVITIDPPDAKDFDDAISLWKDADGHWVLGVHIADVSSFIPMNSALDKEARNRGNSAYLPAKTIPMLPEMLSNGICSLQPEQKRFAKSAYITYDDDGNVLGRSFANSVIRSTARLTYQQADRALRGKPGELPGRVVGLLKDMEQLARIIERRRIRNGMLQLDLPETELVMDKSGRVVDAAPADDSYPHTIIEMFMVEANEAVASLFDRFNIPFMRRIHPDPDELSVTNLSRYVKVCGIQIPRKLDRAAIQNILQSVRKTDLSFPVNLVILRTLEKAEYSPLHIGHYALASQNYCHFTSPIRRYADLLVHRLLDCYLSHKLNLIGLEEVLPESELAEIGRHITFTEQRSEDAEKELKKVLILQMLSEHIGDELDCVVTGLAGFGVFAQCKKYGIEGLIRLEDLGVDQWKYDDKSQCIVGVHSGCRLHLGQSIRVRIAAVNVPARQLDLAPVEPLVPTRESLQKKSSRRKGRTRQTAGRRPRRRTRK